MLAGSSQDHRRQVGGAYPLVGAATLPHLVQLCDHLGDISWAVNDEMDWAGVVVYQVSPVDLLNALERVDGAGRKGVAVVIE